MPALEMTNDLYLDHGLAFLGIHDHSVPAADVEIIIKKNGPHHATLLDTDEGDLCRLYSVEAFSTYILIDPTGTVIMTSQDDRRKLVFELPETVRGILHAANRFATR